MVKLLATCMKEIYELDGRRDGNQLSRLLRSILVADVEFSLKRKEYERVKQLCDSTIHVLIQITTTTGFHFELSEMLATESIALWSKALEMNRESPIKEVLNKWLGLFEHDRTNKIPGAVRWLFYAAFTSDRESIVQTLSRATIQGLEFMMDHHGKSFFNLFVDQYSAQICASADSRASIEDQNVVDDILSIIASIFLMLTHDTGGGESKPRDVLVEYATLLIEKVPREALQDAVIRICSQPSRYGTMGLSSLARLVVILLRGHLNNIPRRGNLDSDPAINDLVLKNLVWMAIPIREQVEIVLESDPDDRVDGVFWAIYDDYELMEAALYPRSGEREPSSFNPHASTG
ncbi:hypothetical protein BO78DRAFT_418034 [Aspergillus sclerotiicarbonarius CBS 121057]|uniref:Uncharacterized protein n=1 Tax=Aspergillus sclerotiicarbonarius (strain CBS 121057 / IBT 28362) TaxID=1448318 RepID=A0A319EC83_ASPSB|nr:hypothetical protein BO78DRAFT_418034 [Aspergillus sclerotiicarbonarius CBS 121057]